VGPRGHRSPTSPRAPRSSRSGRRDDGGFVDELRSKARGSLGFCARPGSASLSVERLEERRPIALSAPVFIVGSDGFDDLDLPTGTSAMSSAARPGLGFAASNSPRPRRRRVVDDFPRGTVEALGPRLLTSPARQRARKTSEGPRYDHYLFHRLLLLPSSTSRRLRAEAPRAYALPDRLLGNLHPPPLTSSSMSSLPARVARTPELSGSKRAQTVDKISAHRHPRRHD